MPAPAPKRPGIQISAISVMLAVGAVLVIIAGLLFVRSNWEGLSNGGRLAFLGAGSMLFFGVSAMAHRIWKLERTGMAFFSIGAAFLPISIWAAGYFDLLGESLSGASNKWTITLAFAVFTVISLIAVRIYQKVGWGIASLGGISAAYIYFVYALTDAFGKPVAWVCLFAAVYALLLAFGAQAVREKLPKPIGKAVMPFACGFAGFVCLLVLLQTDGLYTAAQPVQLLTGAAALLCAACWLAPPMTNMMRGAVSIPFGIMCYYSFLALLHDLSTIKEPVLMSFDIGGWMTCAAAFCTMLCLILLLTKSVPDAAKKGFAILAYVFGVLTAASLVGSKSNLLLTAVLVLLFLLTLIPALKKQGTPRLPQAAAAISAVCICVSLYQVLIRHSAEFSALMSKVNAQLTAAAVLLAFSVLFLLVKRLHSGTAGLLLPVSVTVACLAALDHSRLAGWKIVLALCMIAAVLVYEWCAALWRDEVRPIRYIYAVLMPLTLFTAVLFATVALELEAKASVPVLVWSAISIFSGVVVYFTTRKQFHKVRRVMLGLTVLPPMIIAVFAEGIETGGWVIPQQLLCVGAALFLYRMFANRGFR
ncbi:MAG: hypothetical protein J6P20_08985, partial [Oscillospiraceae bacterium]|nr:hypothetical protein [Oscillospiraceae bacterium]